MSGGTFSIAAPTQKSGGTYSSAAWEEKVSVSTKRGMLMQLLAANKNAAAIYIYVFDGTDATGSTLICPPITVGIGQHVSISEHAGMPFDAGIYVAASSTQGTYTALASNDVRYLVQWGERTPK